MSADHEATKPHGRIPPEKSPGPLELVTGAAISGYRTLKPDDEQYELFADVRRLQAEWDRETRYTFWRAGLLQWPRAAGRLSDYDALSWWVERCRRLGIRDDWIPQRLGRDPETLRRKRLFDRADQRAKEWEWAEETGSRRLIWAPLVVAVERDPLPSPFDLCHDPRLAAFWPEPVQRAEDEFQALTRPGLGFARARQRTSERFR